MVSQHQHGSERLRWTAERSSDAGGDKLRLPTKQASVGGEGLRHVPWIGGVELLPRRSILSLRQPNTLAPPQQRRVPIYRTVYVPELGLQQLVRAQLDHVFLLFSRFDALAKSLRDARADAAAARSGAARARQGAARARAQLDAVRSERDALKIECDGRMGLEDATALATAFTREKVIYTQHFAFAGRA